MIRFILLAVLIGVFTTSNAQKLTFEQLDQLLNSSMDEAEETLFLVGYTFLSKQNISDTAGVTHTFTNRKKTIGTAKEVRKGVYHKDITKSFVKYISYDRLEFERFRKLMIEYQFERSNKDEISENSNYTKDNLKVNFEVSTDKYENKMYAITLQNYKSSPAEKAPKKLSLKNIFKQ